jgi:pheromone shutdown protein TraB
MWREPIRTSNCLWAAFALFTFVVAAFVINLPATKDEITYWHLCTGCLSWWAIDHAPIVVSLMAGWGLILAIPSIALGWVAQAVVQTGLKLNKDQNKPKSATQS